MLQADHEGNKGLKIGIIGGNAGHADGAGVSTGPLEKQRDRLRIEASAGEVGGVVGSFAMRAVALVAFVGPEARLALLDQRLRRRSWRRCGRRGIAIDVASRDEHCSGEAAGRKQDIPHRRFRRRIYGTAGAAEQS